MTSIDRRSFVAGAAALTAGAAQAAPFIWPTTAATEAGFDAGLDARLDKLIVDKRVWNLHGVFVARSGHVVLERYFAGEENNWGKVSDVRFDADTLHNLYSVTKSIVALVYGVALAAGKVPPPEAPLYAQFPEYPDLLSADPRRGERTVGHALAMTLGLQWDEIGLPYDDPKNDEIGMEMAKDRYRFILDRPVVGAPGKRWRYSGGATALIGRLIAKGTGMSLPDYARQALFDPLGLGPTEWLSSKDTWVAANMVPATASLPPRPACACGRAIWHASANLSSMTAR